MNVAKNFPSRILMTTDTIGGVWTFVIDLCTYLKTFNITIALAAMGTSFTSYQRKELERLKNVIPFESSYKLEWMNSPWCDVDRSINWLEAIADKFKPDIIHLNTFSHGVMKHKVPMIITAHSDVYSWWQSVKNENPPYLWQKYFDRVSSGLDNADIIAAPSYSMLKALKQSYNTNTDSIVIYNGRTNSRFRKATKRNFIFSAGRLWDEAKNISLLKEAAQKIKWPVIAAGENDSASSKKFRNIFFAGKLSPQKISYYLSHASIYALPAKYEPFGLSALEAAFSGCALILGDIPSLKEIWEDNAIYINTNNTEDLASKINFLIDNRDVVEEYSDRAFNHAQNFNLVRMGNNYLSLYNSLYTQYNKMIYDENNNVLSFPDFGLESRERSFSKRNSYGINLQGRNS